MAIEVNVTGRFHVLDQPYAAPSKCAFCGLGHNQDGTVSFVDTTLELDFYGVVYICSNCLTEIASSLRYIAPERYMQLRESYQQVYDENDRLAAENVGLRDAINILTGHRCITDKLARELTNRIEGNDEESISRAPERIEQVESKPSAPNSEPGLSDVRGSAKPKPSLVKSKSNDDPLAEFDV